jgi:signal transduction histidine kinase
MRIKVPTLQLPRTQRELVLLLMASFACVLVLTTALATEDARAWALSSGRVLLIAVVTGLALLAAYLVFDATGRARRHARKSAAAADALRRRLATAEALIKAEPQILIHWEQNEPPAIVAQSLSGIPGLPGNSAELLRFGMWLDQRSAASLKEGLERLFATGESFNQILRTEPGGHVEADGRAAGGRAVLRLRDVAGYKKDLGTIADQHARLARDIRSSRALLDALPIPVWLRGPDERLTWVNRAYAEAVEAKSPDEARDGQIELLESRQRKAVERRLKSGKPFHERVPLIAGGERKSHDVIILSLGEATAGAAIDVDAIESAKSKLDQQTAAFDRTLDRVATAVAIFNPERKLSLFNQAYLKLWQLDPDWLRTHPADGAILDRLRELGRLPEVVHYREWKSKLLAAHASGSYEDWWHLPDGRIIHVISEQRPDGGLTYLYDDETERYALESRYNALISVQSETLNSLKEGVAVFATDGRLQLYNAGFASIWKQSRKALDERPHIDEFIRSVSVLCDDATVWRRISEAVTSFSDQRQPLDGQMLRPDGSVIDYATAPLPDGGTLLTFADVTDSKRYERALIERNEALVASDRLKSQFIGHVSYELRAPLTNIIGFSELLAGPYMGTLNDTQREYVDHIMSSSKTLLAIINDILDLATIDAGALELKPGFVDVRGVIAAAVLGVSERAARSDVTLDIAVSDDAVTFTADEARVRQILYNLLSNAVGFSKAGDAVRLGCWRQDGWIVFQVEDQGVGIPKEQQQRIFDRFESRSQGSKHRGAGLGLSIVKNLVELHGGSVSLESAPGLGTRVTVFLPEHGRRHADPGVDAAYEIRLANSAG